ncbi:MAG TPA: alpha/beta hydrolase [Polyangia bacterium]|nr:alpha/beta hydrolase [Polyangia bacterium]
MRGLALGVSVVLTLAAAGLAALLVVPAPRQWVAFLAIAVDEKTYVIAGAAILGTILARASGAGAWFTAQLLLTIAIVGLCALPIFQATSLASRRHVELDFARWLKAPVDIGDAHPSQTLTYATVDGHSLALDVYKPSTADARVPAVVVIHGGGWTAGDKGDASRTSAWLAARGYAVFDVQYRLAPPPTWQAAVGDVKCAIGWVKTRAREAGVDVDPARVALLGRSAGGHLALLAAYAPDDPTLPPSCPVEGDTRVSAVISFYGLADLAWAWDNPGYPHVFDTRARLTHFLGAAARDVPDRVRAVSPIERITTGAPRTLLVHGARDRIVAVEHTARLAERLRSLGVPNDVLVIPYAQHAFDFVAGGLSGQLAEDAVLRTLAATPR